jgi:hypothetical protein
VSGVADDIQFWRAGEWTLVYLNGELVVHGDHYHADEWLADRCGVVIVDDDENSSVPDGHRPVRLLAEAEENRRTAAGLKAEAERKREQARQIMAEADRMDGR